MKRHHTEDIFGVQLCANNPYLLVKCGQMLEKECNIDFIDLNLGCPIDWVFRKGGGEILTLSKLYIIFLNITLKCQQVVECC